MVMDMVAPVSQYVLGVLGGIAAFMLLEILRYVWRDDVTLVSFSVDPERTIRDFEWLTGAAVAMFAAFSLYTVGAYYENMLLIAASRAVEIVFFLVMLRVFYGWRGRFQ